MQDVYLERRTSTSSFVSARGLRHHVRRWGRDAAGQPPLVLLHGWMDVSASFQFFVDALAAADGFDRLVLAPDWRGFGLTEGPAGTDTYWFPDYLADLDALLDQLSPDGPVDLLGHSMGGNVAMTYAGVRPARVRRLVNLEGFGLPQSDADEAPQRLARWLDELKQPQAIGGQADLNEVAARLCRTHPRLTAAQAAWLAPHWAAPAADGRWRMRGDPAHKRINPVLYRREEHVAIWRCIQAPLLWLEGDSTDVTRWWGDRYPRADFEARLAAVARVERGVLADCGHMLHLDQPLPLGRWVSAFLSRP